MEAYLLVEGKDDLHVVAALCQRHCLPRNFTLRTPGLTEGIEALLAGLPVRLKSEELKMLGVLVDADTDGAARWRQVADRLRAAGCEPPSLLGPDGWVGFLGTRRVGVWMMPNNEASGALEDFLRGMVPEGDAWMPEADAVVNCLEQRGLHRYATARSSKARLHTWLAWQSEPGQPFGTAITARSLDADSVVARRFVGWLERLFGSGAVDGAGPHHPV
ncbi:MAG: DUF3226 domain-containing protein [Candidatus Eremiobacterota bacterium]